MKGKDKIIRFIRMILDFGSERRLEESRAALKEARRRCRLVGRSFTVAEYDVDRPKSKK